jgi:hypothetical protein
LEGKWSDNQALNFTPLNGRANFLHFATMSCRNDYEALFLQHGISRRELCSMTNPEFEKTLAYLQETKSEPHDTSMEFSSQYRFVSPKLAQQYQNYAPEPEYPAYDEEEALRQAIMNSLNENYHHSNLNPAANPHDAGSSYAHVYKPASKPDESRLTVNQRIIREQNREYVEACDAAAQANWDARNEAHFQENESMIAAAEQQEREGEVLCRYYALGSEPTTGTTIAVQINGQRVMRRFAGDELCRNVYTWVAGQTIHDDADRLFFDNFDLRAPGIGVLDPEQTLEEQGLSGRVMLHVNRL